MFTLLEGYTRSTGKRVSVQLDEESGFLYVLYTKSGRKVKFNDERYNIYSDFLFLYDYFNLYKEV